MNCVTHDISFTVCIGELVNNLSQSFYVGGFHHLPPILHNKGCLFIEFALNEHLQKAVLSEEAAILSLKFNREKTFFYVFG